MNDARNWLADDQRAQRVVYLLVGVSVVGAIVSVASYRQLPFVAHAIVVLNTALIVAVIAIRALAVKAPWLAVLGIGLEVVAAILHWHSVGLLDLLPPFLGFAVLVVLAFYVHRPSLRDDSKRTASPVNASVPIDPVVNSPESALPRRPLPGDPDFTYPSPPAN
jgi:hypothetical protein